MYYINIPTHNSADLILQLYNLSVYIYILLPCNWTRSSRKLIEQMCRGVGHVRTIVPVYKRRVNYNFTRWNVVVVATRSNTAVVRHAENVGGGVRLLCSFAFRMAKVVVVVGRCSSFQHMHNRHTHTRTFANTSDGRAQSVENGVMGRIPTAWYFHTPGILF